MRCFHRVLVCRSKDVDFDAAYLAGSELLSALAPQMPKVCSLRRHSV